MRKYTVEVNNLDALVEGWLKEHRGYKVCEITYPGEIHDAAKVLTAIDVLLEYVMPLADYKEFIKC